MMFTHAIARLPGEDFARGITTSHLEKPVFSKMLSQHQAYTVCLQSLGLEVTLLPPLTGFPDAYFVEDVAVVTPEVAVITRPGAGARRGEAGSMAPVLAEYRPLEWIRAPGTVDGGDVLMIGSHFFIGLSERTNREGANQLGAILARYGCTWQAVPVGAGLHLKSSVNWVGERSLLLTQDFAGRPEFEGYDRIVLDPAEAYAGNTMWINDQLITPAGFPETRARLGKLGLPIIELETSEAHKMDGGLTCMSLRF
jgi:dimethylargininase